MKNKFTKLRLQFIEAAFIEFGTVNRSLLCETFGISVITASRDMYKYCSFNTGFEYNNSTKQWEKLDTFVPTKGLLSMAPDTLILRIEQLFEIKLAQVAVKTRMGVVQNGTE